MAAKKRVKKMPEAVKQSLAAKKKRAVNTKLDLADIVIGRRRATDTLVAIRVSNKLAKKLRQMAGPDDAVGISEEQFLHMLPVEVEAPHVFEGIVSQEIKIQEPGLERGDNILDKAKEIIYGDREQAYGNPRFNLDSIAQFWTTYLHRKFPDGMEPIPHFYLTAEDVAQLMILLKTARLIHNPTHQDSLTDQAGYAALQDRIQGM